MIFIVSGPSGCGKTCSAEKLKKYFKAKRVVDEWNPHSSIKLRDGDLVLTNWFPRNEEGDKLPGPIYSWKELKNKGIV